MRSPLALVLVPAVVLAALAGCVTPADSDVNAASADVTAVDPAAWDAIRALVGDAPCETDVSMTETSANLVTLSEIVLPDTDMGEIDIRGDRAVFARHAAGGLVYVDISDPREMVELGTFLQEGATAYDIKFLPGLEAAVIGGGEGKLYVVDLTDPANPTLASEADVATQAHMVQPAVVDNVTYVYVASQSNNMPVFVYQLDGYELTLVGEFGTFSGLPLDAVVQSGPLGNHDIAIIEDELAGETLLYLADGVLGWSAWSLADPVSPTRVGGSTGQELGVGYVHTVRVGFFEGKRIVVTMQEVGQNTLKVYDATDLEMPVLLARWNADPTRPTIPQHNIQLLGPWLFMGHYTEGFFVFNLTEVIAGPPLAGTLSMAPAAHWAVENDVADGGPLGFANVWDVSVRRGVVYVSDVSHGTVTAVAFSCLPIGDEAASAVL